MTPKEIRIFKTAFKLGFSKSFDGWNGETFKQFDNTLYEDGNMFQTVLEQELKNYEREQTELARTFTIPNPIDTF